MYKKKILMLGLCVVLSGSMLAGCGSSKKQEKKITVEKDASKSDEKKDDTSDTEGKPGQPPEGENPGNPPEGEPPEGAPDGKPGEKPDGEPPAGKPGEGPGGQVNKVESYDAVQEYKKDTSTENQNYESTGKDESAVHVLKGAKVTLKNANINRRSTDSTGGDTASFYGVGAAALVTEGTLTMQDGNISTESAGGAGVFAYGKGVANLTNVNINTKKDTSGGIHVAGGGTLKATNVHASTEGESSAAIRSDRGGGTMDVDGGSFTTQGTGSPAVYSTAKISVKNASLTANKSEVVCIEGKNSLKLDNCNLVSNMPEDSRNDCTWSVIVYQSMSGDAQTGKGTFTMNGGSLNANNGGAFYTTNTESAITLNNVTVNGTENTFFLKCTGNSNERGWGQSGKNGAKCTFKGISQQIRGNIIYDSISNLDATLEKGSTFTGAVVDDETNAGKGGSGHCNLTISSDSQWIVTGNSTLSKLTSKGIIKDQAGRTVTIRGKDGKKYVKGDSEYTITVKKYVG